jgi:glyoxylase-like metal-dependent hydrolase (beta-lactamase superfamily II)
MLKPFLITACAVVLLSAAAPVAIVQAAQNPPAPPMVVDKVRDDLYVIRGEGGNITVYVTDEGVVLVDDKFERNYDEVQAKLKSISDKPVKYVINTHPHGDHTGGNAKLLPSVQVIAHANARAAMIKGKLPGPPQLTYTDEIRITLGGKEVIASHFGPCHTDGDTFVYFPAARVVSAGDCFNTGNGQGLNLTGSPTFSFYIDYTTGGSLLGRAKVADSVLRLDFDTVVPGHGPLTNRGGFVRWRGDVEAITNRIRALVRDGRSKDDIAKAMVSEFGWEPGGRTIVASLDGMMTEVTR